MSKRKPESSTPEEWETPTAQEHAQRAFAELVARIKRENGYTKYDEIGCHLDWGGQSTISHLVNGQKKVGPTALLKIIAKGYDPTEILPAHPISVLWAKANRHDSDDQGIGDKARARDVPALRLDEAEITEFLKSGTYRTSKRLPLVDTQRLLPKTFIVQMPDESLNNPAVDPLVPPGYNVFFDPDAKPKPGEPVLAATDGGEIVIRALDWDGTITPTQEGHGPRIKSFTVLAVAYYAVMDF